MRTRCSTPPLPFLRIGTALVAGCLLLAPAVVLAFAVQTVQPGSKTLVKWQQSKITYFLHPAGSADVTPKIALDELRAGFVGWQQQACSNLTFVEGYHCNTALKQCLYDKSGSSPKACSADADCPSASNLKLVVLGANPNGRNELAWVETSGKGAWTFGQYVLGVTSPMRYQNGVIFESDIAFNGFHHKWTAKAGDSGWDKQHILSVGIHEIGHFFGVQHMLGGWNPNDPPTMAPSVAQYGLSASLNADDVKAPCFLHPKSSYVCKNDADCPYMNHDDDATGAEYYSAKMVCQGSSCVFGGELATGTKALGDDCAVPKDCKTGLFCQPYGSSSVCSQACTTTKKDCPSGFACFGYQGGGGKGACMADKGAVTPSKKPGETCASSAECVTLSCVQEVCRVKCTPKAPVECNAETEECAVLPASGIGACVPKAPVTKLPFDGACFLHEECASNVCMKVDADADSGNCRLACTGKGTCAGEFGCVDQGDGVLGCLPGTDKEGLGKACKTPVDCQSGLCIGDVAAQYCSASCEAGKPGSCPCGMGCEATSAGQLCLAGAKVGCVANGAACAAGSECTSGACVDKVCRASCSIVTVAACGVDEGCKRLQSGAIDGSCAKKGGATAGTACAADGDCQSLLCDFDLTTNGERRCLQPCPSGNQETCGQGLACFAMSKALGQCQLAGAAITPVGSVVPPPPASNCSASRSGGEWGAVAALAVAAWVCLRRRRGDVEATHA